MLNPGGKDILGASDYNFADVAVGALQRSQQIQDLSGIDVDSDGFFYALDSTYGRIFWYDEDYNLLSVFGGSFGDGDQKGTFKLASGIAVNGTDVVISDSQANSLTVFAITDYGKLVRDSQLITLSGDFAAANVERYVGYRAYGVFFERIVNAHVPEFGYVVELGAAGFASAVFCGFLFGRGLHTLFRVLTEFVQLFAFLSRFCRKFFGLFGTRAFAFCHHGVFRVVCSILVCFLFQKWNVEFHITPLYSTLRRGLSVSSSPFASMSVDAWKMTIAISGYIMM